MLTKAAAIEALGETRLLMPLWLKAALAANDRIKFLLTLLQVAVQHAGNPGAMAGRQLQELGSEREAAGVEAPWMESLVLSSTLDAGVVGMPEWPQLRDAIMAQLTVMARPVLVSGDQDTVGKRVEHWLTRLQGMAENRMSEADIAALTHGSRSSGDSLHLLVMDLHKRLNQLAASQAGETIDGAHAWSIATGDRKLIQAFMRGLNRTAPLRFDHPGLDTAATRDGPHLIIQNDIGTNDAHLMVLHVAADSLTLTYSDLHHGRFAFFQELLERGGATWTVVAPQKTAGLNADQPYWLGTARFDCSDDVARARALEYTGSRMVYVIDWNRARKRLQLFVPKKQALHILAAAAQLDCGHMAWLLCGGESLIYQAMAAVGAGLFRIGDRLDTVLGQEEATSFLIQVLQLCYEAKTTGLPLKSVEDQCRLLLSRHVRSNTAVHARNADHAAWCQALAQLLHDTLALPALPLPALAASLEGRARRYEKQADLLVAEARADAERHPRWREHAIQLEQADDVIDALEEAAFVLSMLIGLRPGAWTAAVRQALHALTQTLLEAIQDYVRLVEIVRFYGQERRNDDAGIFLDTFWRIKQAEECADDQLRDLRRLALARLADASTENGVVELASLLEAASDCLLRAAFGLRKNILDSTEENL